MSRLKREDCKRTKHDREFSKWEILIGPSDWEEYLLGKEGAERYRVHNLPKNSGPGVYELGIAVSRTGLGREIGKLDPERIVVVYLGQADNVRTRLQHYGRTGAHLGNSCPPQCKTVIPQKGPGLFEEILSRGYPIIFRWAPMQSKSDALKTETELLNTFDYAWNTSINGTRRPDDILNKLKKISSSNIHFSDIARKLVPFSQKQVGIRIKARKFPSAEEKIDTSADEESQNIFSRVFKFGRSQPKLVLDRSVIVLEDTTICGMVLGLDSICRRPPVEGRKRCAEHKGMRIKGPVSVALSNSNVNSQSTFSAPSSSLHSEELQPVTFNNASRESFTPICGFILADGSPCISQPLKGNKRCLEHKGRKILQQTNSASVTKEKLYYLPDPVSESKSSEICFSGEVQAQAFAKRLNANCDTICGVVLGDGLVCTRKPVVGRVRCEEHKGIRVTRFATTKFAAEKQIQVV
ncbi:protein EFFECTOR OF TRANSCRIPTION 2 isoform X1 [Morus notabilis]|nr:protein EFFECTOR OF TRANSCRIPTION 2 isoform X1 [Morus notabilis]